MKLGLWQLCAIFVTFTALGCSDQVRVKDNELVGTWVTNTNSGKEKLVLIADKTYVQTFMSPAKQFVNRGTWKLSNQFLGGSEIELLSANVSEDESSGSPPRYGALYLQVYRLDGKLKLARNAAFDWYYEREQNARQ